VLERVRQTDPAAYLRVAAVLVPKEMMGPACLKGCGLGLLEPVRNLQKVDYLQVFN
jgi:hypothetical protein